MLTDVIRTTTTTNIFKISTGNDFTINAAINTPTTPKILNAIDTFLLNAPSLTNRIEAVGCKNAADPIISGNATNGDKPKVNTKAIIGAKHPIPKHCVIPNIKDPIHPITNPIPVSWIALPPGGINPVILKIIINATINNATAIESCIFFSGNLETSPAPK